MPVGMRKITSVSVPTTPVEPLMRPPRQAYYLTDDEHLVEDLRKCTEVRN
jgi:hypothetical protein